MTRPCPARIALIGLPAAFALGCIPSARLIARLVGAAEIMDSGDGKPGAANVARTLGWKPGAATLGIDIVKGSAGVGTARALGAGPHVAGALALTPVVAHVAVVRGRGAATALGAALALDPLATAAVLPAVVGGALAKRAAVGAMVAALGLPVASFALGHRCRAVWAAGLPAIMACARLRASDGGAAACDPRVAWERFWFDREPVVGEPDAGEPEAGGPKAGGPEVGGPEAATPGTAAAEPGS